MFKWVFRVRSIGKHACWEHVWQWDGMRWFRQLHCLQCRIELHAVGTAVSNGRGELCDWNCGVYGHRKCAGWDVVWGWYGVRRNGFLWCV